MVVAVSRISLPHSVAEQVVADHALYRPDVDGLRAVAVLAVMAFHAAPQLLPGGFAGVDVFFVISGFLISGIIFRGLERGDFSFVDFYARRVKRIFPALLTMLMTVWVLAWPILLWDEYQLLGKHIAAGAGFVANLLLFRDLNPYFGAINTPLIHLWSLGVEEQFYIFWPLLVFALWKWRAGRLATIVVFAAISFALNVTTISSNWMASFYLPTSRLWELALGGILAYANLRHEAQRVHGGATAPSSNWSWLPSGNTRGLLGALLVAASFVMLKSDLSFPGWRALLPCAGALLVISAGPRSWFNRLVLAHPAMVFVGLISYPLYLWHWPLLSIVHIYLGDEFSLPVALATLAASFLLAVLTYKYVERPIRFSNAKVAVSVALCVVMAVWGMVGYMTFTSEISARPVRGEVDQLVRASTQDWLPDTDISWTYDTDGLLMLGNASRRVLFIGDSNMQQYYPRIAKLLQDNPENERGAAFAVRAGCAPAVVDLVKESYRTIACRRFLGSVMEYAQTPEVDTIVIGAYWYGYVAVDVRRATPGPLKPGTDAALDNLRQLIADFVAQGKRVYVLLHMPSSRKLDPRDMIRRSLLLPGFTVAVSTPTRAEIEAALGPIRLKLRQTAEAAGAVVIDPMPLLCKGETCPALTQRGEPMYRDWAHLSPAYVRENVRFLDKLVLDAGTN